MPKKLTRTGNSLAVILDRTLLEHTGIDEATPLEISTDGDSRSRGTCAAKTVPNPLDTVIRLSNGLRR